MIILSSGCIFSYNNCKGRNSCQYFLPPIKLQTENFLPHSLVVGKACSECSSPPALHLMAYAALSRLLKQSPFVEMFPSLFSEVRNTTSVFQDSCPWDARYQINTNNMSFNYFLVCFSIDLWVSLIHTHTHTHTHTHMYTHTSFKAQSIFFWLMVEDVRDSRYRRTWLTVASLKMEELCEMEYRWPKLLRESSS